MKDVWLDRMLHRRLSRPLCAGAVRIGIAPNAVTVASLLVGLGAAWGVALGSVAGAWLGLALYLAAVVLDHADGEVARATGTASRLGHCSTSGRTPPCTPRWSSRWAWGRCRSARRGA
jgi:hypothetical protein